MGAQHHGRRRLVGVTVERGLARQQGEQGGDQALIQHQGFATLVLANQFLQYLHGQLLAGFPAVEAVAVVLHEEHQLVTAVGEVQLDRRTEAAQQ